MSEALDPGFKELEELPPEIAQIKALEAHKKGLNVHQRLAQAMRVVTYVQKGDLKKGMQYRVVTHDAVTAKVRPALLDAGIVYYPQNMMMTQDGNRSQMTLDLRFVNIDNPEDFFDVPCAGYGIDNQDKGPGKAVSYCVKMGLLKTMGLETGEDPDLDQKSVHEPVITAPDGSIVPTLEQVLVECADVIDTMVDAIERDDLTTAANAYFADTTAGQKMAMMVAPTKHKNAPFTTKQRDIIKSAEFRKAADMSAHAS